MGIPGVEYFAHAYELPPRVAKEFLLLGERMSAQRAEDNDTFVCSDSGFPVYFVKIGTNVQFGGDIKWNFAKFLIGPDGKVLCRYSPMVTPEDEGLRQDIEAALG